MTIQADPAIIRYEILETAREQVLEEGRVLTQYQLLDVLRPPNEALPPCCSWPTRWVCKSFPADQQGIFCKVKQ